MATVATPRPTKGFTSARAEKWVLTSALITGVVYLVRHLVEGQSSAPPATSAARAFLGQGSPPNVGQWLIAYATGFLILAVLAALAPELAAGSAMLIVFSTFIESGGQLAADLKTLESGAGGGSSAALPAGYVSPAARAAVATSQANLAATMNSFGFPPSPQSVGASVASKQSQIAAINKQILAEAPSLPAGYTVKVVNGIAELLHNGTVVQKG